MCGCVMCVCMVHLHRCLLEQLTQEGKVGVMFLKINASTSTSIGTLDQGHSLLSNSFK